MDHYDRVAGCFQAHMEHTSLAVDAIASVCEHAAELATAAILADQKMVAVGAGADAAAAAALAELLNQGYLRERPSLPGVELTARTAKPQAAGVRWLADQLRALAQQGDLVVVFCSTLGADDIALLAEAGVSRGCEVVWIGNQGPGVSLAFPEAPVPSRLLLNQASALCLVELIDINTFGPMEE